MVQALKHFQAVQVLTDARIDPTKDEIIWNDLVDNRDFKAMQSWDPLERLSFVQRFSLAVE